MELTVGQRAELAAIRAKALASASHPYTRHARPTGGKEAFKAWGRKLDALGSAWADLDHDTQMYFLVAVVGQWTDDESQTIPDLSVMARELKEALALPQHKEEDHPGLKDATLFLWRAFYADWGGPQVFDREARTAISAELAALFGLSQEAAERRARGSVEELRRAGLIGG